jgi:hypothetical protein
MTQFKLSVKKDPDIFLKKQIFDCFGETDTLRRINTRCRVYEDQELLRGASNNVAPEQQNAGNSDNPIRNLNL